MASDSEIKAAAESINDGIYVMEKLYGNPKQHINQLVENWYYESKADGFSENECKEYVINIVSHITKAKYQKIAHAHLLKITRDNLANNKKLSDNAWLTPKGNNVFWGLITGLLAGGFMGPIGYIIAFADTGSVKTAEMENKDAEQRPYIVLGVTVMHVVYAILFF